jgi:hypothetical protein
MAKSYPAVAALGELRYTLSQFKLENVAVGYEVVGQRMKLETDGVSGDRPARQPCPLDRAFLWPP